jgi:hypothetical protein
MLLTKICAKCKLELDTSLFHKRNKSSNGFKPRCKKCTKEDNLKNSDKIKLQRLNFRKKNRKRLVQDTKKYVENNKEVRKEYERNYYLLNKNKILAKNNIYTKIKRKTDPFFRLRGQITNAISRALKLQNGSKNNESCIKYLPYTIFMLKEHIESLFEPWMNWQNQGMYPNKTWVDEDQSTWVWSLDHIIPQSTLPYSNMNDENFIKCWSLDNLRPYSAKQNWLDGINKVRHKTI